MSKLFGMLYCTIARRNFSVLRRTWRLAMFSKPMFDSVLFASRPRPIVQFDWAGYGEVQVDCLSLSANSGLYNKKAIQCHVLQTNLGVYMYRNIQALSTLHQAENTQLYQVHRVMLFSSLRNNLHVFHFQLHMTPRRQTYMKIFLQPTYKIHSSKLFNTEYTKSVHQPM